MAQSGVKLSFFPLCCLLGLPSLFSVFLSLPYSWQDSPAGGEPGSALASPAVCLSICLSDGGVGEHQGTTQALCSQTQDTESLQLPEALIPQVPGYWLQVGKETEMRCVPLAEDKDLHDVFFDLEKACLPCLQGAELELSPRALQA